MLFFYTGYPHLGYPCPTFIAHYIGERSADAEPQVQIDNDAGE
jgi:hypothetical protein